MPILYSRKLRLKISNLVKITQEAATAGMQKQVGLTSKTLTFYVIISIN